VCPLRLHSSHLVKCPCAPSVKSRRLIPTLFLLNSSVFWVTTRREVVQNEVSGLLGQEAWPLKMEPTVPKRRFQTTSRHVITHRTKEFSTAAAEAYDLVFIISVSSWLHSLNSSIEVNAWETRSFPIVVPVHAMTVYRERLGAIRTVNLGDRWSWGVNFTPQILHPHERSSEFKEKGTGCAPEPLSTSMKTEKYLNGIRTQGHPLSSPVFKPINIPIFSSGTIVRAY
jgi:hypothetical protein